MKKRNITLFALLGSLSISASFLLAVNNNNKKTYNKASATVSNLVTGRFAKVTNVNQITSGGSYIFVSDNGYALSDVWGNPGYVHGQTNGVSFGNQGFVTLYNSPASVFGVEAVDGKFAFYTSMQVTGEYLNKVYLAYNNNASADHFEAVGYFYGDRTGVAKEKRDNDAYWSFRYDEDNGNYITHVGQGGDLGFTFGYAPRFCRNADHRVEIYKEYVDEAYSIHVSHVLETDTYSKGDEISLSKLEIGFSSTYHNGTYAYDDHKHLFSCEKYASGSGEHDLEITFMNLFTFTVEITVNDAEYYATQVTSSLSDYRGQYMFVSTESTDQVLKGDDFGKTTALLADNGKTKVSHTNEEYVKFVVEKDNSNYYIKNYQGKYLSFDGSLKYTNTKSFPMTFEYDEGGIRVKGGNNKYLNFDTDDYKFCLGDKTAADQVAVFLYKYDYTNDVIEGLEGFANGFLNATMVCDPQGMANYITSEIWSDQSDAFAILDPFAQAELINKSYNPGHTEDDVVAQAVERYDYIVNKYSYSNFIGRTINRALQNQYHNVAIDNIFNNESNEANIVITIVAISLVAVLLYSIIRVKKKYTK